MPKYDFTGKVVLVTGSSMGIGAAIAIQFAKYGAQVVITGRNAQSLDQVSAKIEEITGEKPLQIIGDLMDFYTPEKLINETVEKLGRLDVLVNNAGAATSNDSLANPDLLQGYDKCFILNFRSVLHLIQLAAPHLENTKGNIVIISSIAGWAPHSDFLVYSCSKAAVNMMNKLCAQELSAKDIRVNCVSPGLVSTEFFQSMGQEESFLEKNANSVLKFNALNHVAQPDDIANVVVFLASDDAINMTGSNVLCDSGSLVKRNIVFQ